MAPEAVDLAQLLKNRLRYERQSVIKFWLYRRIERCGTRQHSLPKIWAVAPNLQRTDYLAKRSLLRTRIIDPPMDHTESQTITVQQSGASVSPEAKGRHYQRMIRQAKGLQPLRTAVVHPVDAVSLSGAVEAAAAGLIVPPPTRVSRKMSPHALFRTSSDVRLQP
jgi:hypothetical protein